MMLWSPQTESVETGRVVRSRSFPLLSITSQREQGIHPRRAGAGTAQATIAKAMRRTVTAENVIGGLHAVEESLEQAGRGERREKADANSSCGKSRAAADESAAGSVE